MLIIFFTPHIPLLVDFLNQGVILKILTTNICDIYQVIATRNTGQWTFYADVWSNERQKGCSTNE